MIWFGALLLYREERRPQGEVLVLVTVSTLEEVAAEAELVGNMSLLPQKIF